MKKVYLALCVFVLLLFCGCRGGVSNGKSVSLNLSNYKDYLNVSVSRGGSLGNDMYFSVSSRNSDYVFENCVIEFSYGNYNSATVYVDRQGNGSASGYNVDITKPKSYNVTSVSGTVSKNQLN